jgi:hypothetical protein
VISDYLPQFLPQCCDAVLYLLQGQTCATSNECYDQLRPVGAQLWFSLPYRFGLPAEILILVHWLLLFFSIALSVKAISTLYADTLCLHHKLILSFCSALIHLVFFWPVMSLALTDAPAALFLLIAIWLLLLQGKTSSASQLACAGLLLGLSAWIRFAYFYPLLAALAVYVVLWLFDKQRRYVELLLLTALIPIAIQFSATFFHHGTFGFLGPDATRGLSSEHSLSTAAGQENILPQQQYLWPTPCARHIGIEQAWQENDLASATCLMANRFYFSFGSYSPDTYMFAATNQLIHSAIEHVGLVSRWHYWNAHGIQRTSAEDMPTPDGSDRRFNEKLVVTETSDDAGHAISVTRRLPAGKPYTFSVWLWSPQDRTIDLMLGLPDAGVELARSKVMMTAQPFRFSVTGTIPQPTSWFASHYADMEVVIGSTTAHDVSFDNQLANEFYAWGAQLEQSAVMTDYQKPDARVTRTDFRDWSPVLLVANIIAMLSVLWWFWLNRKQVTRLQMLPAILMVLIVGEIVVTQPEQRFVIAVEIYIWMTVAITVIKFLKRLQSHA